jgi:hypothetical protein
MEPVWIFDGEYRYRSDRNSLSATGRYRFHLYFGARAKFM